MKIPFADLSLQHKPLKKQLGAAFDKVMSRGNFILGEEVAAFEKEFARMCGTTYAVGVNSGTDALFLALKACGIGAGDEVIVPTYTYIASALAVSYTGAQPVFVDIDERTYNLDPALLEEALTPRTKAIMPVHLYGQPAAMDAVISLARRRGLMVVEDAAQAHGAALRMSDGKWRGAGAIGDIGAFSFYPSKNLGGCGDGGMLTTGNEKLYEKLLMLRDYGRISKYEHALIGYNARLDTIQAALLRVKLPHLKEWNESRRTTAALYTRLFKGVSGITTPYEGEGVRHVYHVYAVRLRERARVIRALAKNEIGAIIHYPIPIHLQEAYKDLGHKQGDFPAAEKISSEILSLPMFPGMKREQVEFVAATIIEALGA